VESKFWTRGVLVSWFWCRGVQPKAFTANRIRQEIAGLVGLIFEWSRPQDGRRQEKQGAL
jgi:hypothetical protein